MTQLVGRLERDGLVRRRRAPADRRGVLVEITDAGRTLVADRRRQRSAALDRLVARLDPAEQRALTSALPALRQLCELASRSDARSDARPGH
jgi:DNA-binding MarR family transcriptional regulator